MTHRVHTLPSLFLSSLIFFYYEGYHAEHTMEKFFSNRLVDWSMLAFECGYFDSGTFY
jgi:hypothetical protein